MSEPDGDYLLQPRWLALALFFLVLLTMLIIDGRQDSKTRDLQRRVGQLEELNKKMTLTSDLRYRVIAIGDNYHWIDRQTSQSVSYENGDSAQFPSLDKAITAFIDGKLIVKRNERMESERR
jgi:hypothetical protein